MPRPGHFTTRQENQHPLYGDWADPRSGTDTYEKSRPNEDSISGHHKLGTYDKCAWFLEQTTVILRPRVFHITCNFRKHYKELTKPNNMKIYQLVKKLSKLTVNTHTHTHTHTTRFTTGQPLHIQENRLKMYLHQEETIFNWEH
jgi:hypothetical protein